MQSDNITPERFLNTLFPFDELGPSRAMLTRHRGDSWVNQTYSGTSRRGKIGVGTGAWYYCISTVAQGSRRRRYSDLVETWVIVCDDVGTKAKTPPVPPSYIIETSADNFQWGYLISPVDATTPEGRTEVDSVLYSLAQAGYNDPGCRNASRVVRLPGSLHKTGFVARVTYWQPDRVWALEDLLPQMGVEQLYPASSGGAVLLPGKYTQLAQVADPAYAWLADNWTVLGHNSEWVHIECPWRAAHTDGAQGPSSTGFSPEHYGTGAPAFKCLHGHCSERKLADFRGWLLEQGCTPVWGDDDINTDDINARLAALLGALK